MVQKSRQRLHLWVVAVVCFGTVLGQISDLSNITQLAEKQFLIPNDDCIEYFVPPGRKFGVSVAQLLFYNQSSKMLEWQYTNQVQLPVFCLRCKAEADYDRNNQNKTLFRMMEQVYSKTFPAYFGNVLFEGSILCVTISGGKASLNSYFSNMVAEGSPVNELLQNQVEHQASNSAFMHFFSRNQVVSTLNLTGKVYGSELAQTLKSRQGIGSLNLTQSYFSYLKMVQIMYPEFHVVYSSKALVQQDTPLSRKLGSLCEYVDIWSYLNSIKQFSLADVTARLTVLSKQWGCLSCSNYMYDYIWNEAETTQVYSYYQVPGFKEFPRNWQLAQNPNFYFEGKCGVITYRYDTPPKDEERRKMRGFTDFISVVDQTFYSRPCHEFIQNCAICDSVDPTNVCHLCFDNFALVNQTMGDGSIKPSCLSQCPPGHKKITMLSGFSFCKPCSIKNCQQCVDIKSKVKNLLFPNAEPAIQEFEVCQKCQGSFKLNQEGTVCSIPIESISSITVRKYTPNKDGDLLISFILEPQQFDLFDTSKKPDIAAILADEAKDKLLFIQQALSKFNKIAQDYRQVNATIWLTKGDHFFFFCEKLLKREEVHPLGIDAFCQIESMVGRFPKTDNVNLFLRSLDCDSDRAKATDEARYDPVWFNQVCTKRINDERAVVHVSSPFFMFNVTLSLLVRDVVFDGVNAFSGLSAFPSNDNSASDFIQLPYWPQDLCRQGPPSSSQIEKTRLLDLVDAARSSPSFGRTFQEPISKTRAVKNPQNNQIYQVVCRYNGDRVNTYNTSADDQISQVLKQTYPSIYGPLTSKDAAARQLQILKYVQQQAFNYSEPSYQATTVSKAATLGSELYGLEYQMNRSRSLFNLYAFTYTDSFQKNIMPTSYEHRVNEMVGVPTLNLTNVEVKNMLYDYDSLIKLQTDNFEVTWDTRFQTQLIRQFGNYNISGSVFILNSRITDCNFRMGMLWKPPAYIDASVVVQYQNYDFQKPSEILNRFFEQLVSQQRISFIKSKFSNLNYGEAVLALPMKNTSLEGAVNDRGVVVSIHDYEGGVEILDCEVSHNLVVIPTAVVSNLPRFKSDVVDFTFSDFVYPKQVDQKGPPGPKPPNQKDPKPTEPQLQVNNYLKLEMTDPNSLNHAVHFLTYFNSLADSHLLQQYQTISAVLLKGVRADQILISGTKFTNNIGLHGGAIHIDLGLKQDRRQPSFDESTPAIILKDNKFTKNMAYFAGNAVFIKGGQKVYSLDSLMARESLLNIDISGCSFEMNHGPVQGEGGAIHIDGLQDDAYHQIMEEQSSFLFSLKNEAPQVESSTSTQISISNSNFTLNLAGVRGSAINLISISTSLVSMSGLTIFNNSGALSLLESELEFPFYSIVTQRKFLLNYLNPRNDPRCMNEVSSIGFKECNHDQQVYRTNMLVLPNNSTNRLFGLSTFILTGQMHGTVHLANVHHVIIADSTFQFNDAPPLLDKDHYLDLVRTTKQIQASCIFVGGSITNFTIFNSSFSNNSFPSFDSLLQSQNLDIHNHFPLNYFKHGLNPLISWQNTSGQPVKTQARTLTVSNCKFIDQINFQRLVTQDLNLFYQGGLLDVDVTLKHVNVKFLGNIVFNSSQVGTLSSLISVRIFGEFQMDGNIFSGIGFVRDPISLPRIAAVKNLTTLFEEIPNTVQSTIYGVLQLEIYGRQSPARGLDTISNNFFNKIFAQVVGVVQLRSSIENSKLRLVRNQYTDIHTLGPSIFQYINNEQGNAIQNNLNLQMFRLAVIEFTDEVVANVSSADPYPNTGILRFTMSADNKLIVMVKKSVFALDRFGSYGFLVENAAIICQDLLITQDFSLIQEYLRSPNLDPELSQRYHYSTESLAALQVQQSKVQNLLQPNPSTSNLFELRRSHLDWISNYSWFSMFRMFFTFNQKQGTASIFEGTFMEQDGYQGFSSFQNVVFRNISSNPTSVIQIDQYSKVIVSYCQFNNISTLVIQKRANTELVVADSLVQSIGLHLITADIDQKTFEMARKVTEVDRNVSGTTLGKIKDGFLIASGGVTRITNCNFTHSITSMGLFQITGNEKMQVSQSNFSRIMSTVQSSIFFITENIFATVVFEENLVRDTIGDQGMFFLNYAQMLIRASRFESNFCFESAHYITMIFSYVEVVESFIDNYFNPFGIVSQAETGVVSLNYESMILFKNSTVQHVKAKTIGMIDSINFGTVVIQQSLVKNVTADSSAFSLYTSEKIEITDSVMIEVQSIEIKSMMNNNKFLISNLTIYPDSNTLKAISIIHSDGLINNTRVLYSEAVQNLSQPHKSQAMYFNNPQQSVLVANSEIANVTFPVGRSAVEVASAQNLTFKGCTFKNNTNTEAGAMYIGAVKNVNLISNKFVDNSAVVKDASTFNLLLDQNTYRGGAIFIDCIKSPLADCKVSLSGSNTFVNNSAKLQGGAISISSAEFEDLDNSTVFLNNSAAGVRSDVSYFVTDVEIEFGILTTKVEEVTGSDGKPEKQIVIPSGQVIKIVIKLLDRFGKITKNENQVHCTIELESLMSQDDDDETQANLINNNAQSVNGTITFDRLVISNDPGTSDKLIFKFTGLQDNGIPKKFVNDPPVVRIYFRKCIAGEEQTSQGTCQKCKYGFYLLDPPEGQQNCQKCHANAICYGENIIAPKTGFYRHDPSTDNIVQCFNKLACLGGNQLNTSGECNTGYSGFMCGSCKNGWVNDGSVYCIECGSDGVSLFDGISRIVIITTIVLFFSRLLTVIAQNGNPQYAAFVSLSKLMIQHCIIISSITQIQYNWSGLVSDIIYMHGKIATFLSNFISFQCLLVGSNSFFKNLVLTCLSPLLLFVWFGLLFGVYGLIKGNFAFLKSQLLCAMIVVFWLVHTDICHQIFASFTCIDADGSGVRRLYKDLEIICWESTHLLLVCLVSIPSLLIYLLIVPILLYRKLKKDKKLINDTDLKCTLSRADLYTVTLFQTQWGFLFQESSFDFYYWEMVLLLRRTLVIFATEYLACISSIVQVLATIMICTFFMIINMKLQPLVSVDLNRLAILSQVTQMLLMYFGLFYITGSDQWYMQSLGTNYAFVILIFIPIFVFMLKWVNMIKLQVMIMTFNYNKKLFKCMTLNLIDLNQFYRDHIVQDELKRQLQHDQEHQLNTERNINTQHDESILEQRSLERQATNTAMIEQAIADLRALLTKKEHLDKDIKAEQQKLNYQEMQMQVGLQDPAIDEINNIGQTEIEKKNKLLRQEYNRKKVQRQNEQIQKQEIRESVKLGQVNAQSMIQRLNLSSFGLKIPKQKSGDKMKNEHGAKDLVRQSTVPSTKPLFKFETFNNLEVIPEGTPRQGQQGPPEEDSSKQATPQKNVVSAPKQKPQSQMRMRPDDFNKQKLTQAPIQFNLRSELDIDFVKELVPSKKSNPPKKVDIIMKYIEEDPRNKGSKGSKPRKSMKDKIKEKAAERRSNNQEHNKKPDGEPNQ